MERKDRFKEIGKHAFPDYRLLPKSSRDAVDRLPREVRRKGDRLIKKSLEVVRQNTLADEESGAGYLIDQQIREFLTEYNGRLLGHGLMTMPSSFNVFEGFIELRTVYPADYFAIRLEKDHLFSLADFLDFATSAESNSADMRSLFDLREGVIYNFTPVGDLHEMAFLHADSSRFVVAGFSIVRHGNQLHWAMIGGPVCDLAERTRELQANPLLDRASRPPPQKAFIRSDQTLENRAEPLKGTTDVWKTVAFGRFNLQNTKHEVRYIAIDHGNAYFILTDDPEIYSAPDHDGLTPDQRERLEAMGERLDEDRILFEIAETCFQLPAYFAFRIALVREARRETTLAKLPPKERAKLLEAPPARRPLFKTVAALDLIEVGRQPAVRAYRPPQYKVEVDGFWRRLAPDAVGRDAEGNPVKGRTWVKRHLRWRNRPERQSMIFVKSSVAFAKVKAAAIIASDPTARVVGDWVPPVFSFETEPEEAVGGWLYVIRCPLMDDDIYKIGWTSLSPKERAESLSRATGVPMAYIVVESWNVADGRRAEAAVHLALSEFRINRHREFFKAAFEKIRALIVPALNSLAFSH
jgi:hypothetical protein